MALAWGITPGRCCSVSFDIGIRPDRLTAAGVGWVLFPYSLVYLIEVSGIYWRIFWIVVSTGESFLGTLFVLKVSDLVSFRSSMKLTSYDQEPVLERLLKCRFSETEGQRSFSNSPRLVHKTLLSFV